MSNFVKLNITCPNCGRLLQSKTVNADNISTAFYTLNCPNCKAKVAVQETQGQAFTSIK